MKKINFDEMERNAKKRWEIKKQEKIEKQIELRFKDKICPFLDVNDVFYYKNYIKWCITENIESPDVFTQTEALNYFKSEIQDGLFYFDEKLDKKSIDNSNEIIDWIKEQIAFYEKANNLNTNNEKDEPSIDLSDTKDTKSLMLKGKKLNLSERFKIANKVLNIDKTIRLLNIKDLEKYQLLAFILGCDKDNARNIMNGSYKSKDRNLDDYFDELGLNE